MRYLECGSQAVTERPGRHRPVLSANGGRVHHPTIKQAGESPTLAYQAILEFADFWVGQNRILGPSALANDTSGSSANFFHHGGLSRTGLMVHHPTSAPYRRRRRASEGRCPPLLALRDRHPQERLGSVASRGQLLLQLFQPSS